MKTLIRPPMKTLVTAMTFTIFGMGVVNAQAATDYFLQIDSIVGESTDGNHRDWIDVNSFSWGVSNSGSVVSGGGSSGSPVFSPFSWTQNLDMSVPSLFVGVASGDYYRNATLDVQRTDGRSADVFFRMSFDNVLLTRLNINGAGDLPGVAAAFDYSKITMTYWPQNANGSLGNPVVGGWDLTINEPTFFGSPAVLQGLFLAGPTPSAVPVPAAAWLFGSGLLGLVGIARRKTGSRAQ